MNPFTDLAIENINKSLALLEKNSERKSVDNLLKRIVKFFEILNNNTVPAIWIKDDLKREVLDLKIKRETLLDLETPTHDQAELTNEISNIADQFFRIIRHYGH